MGHVKIPAGIPGPRPKQTGGCSRASAAARLLRSCAGECTGSEW